ncbi:hypothetical protein D6D01_02666 [Aureobasidium pullulans]|uniref:F-box domain-containing protein n=1 Tax=Aureobasidium pullulans TaxID=5580 RepID=A0A4V4JX72_AURPU|nr:hypothetical protein D6D01_02666 [Aureobasidium pullulans]
MVDSARITEEVMLLQTFPQTTLKSFREETNHRFELAAIPQSMPSDQPTGFLDLPFELRLKIYHLNLVDDLKLENMTSNSIHVRPPDLKSPSEVFPSFSTCPLDWTRTIETKPERPIREPAIFRAARLVRTDILPLLYKPDTPTSYTFHACPATQIRNTLHRIHNEDIPLGLRLETLTFCLPKAIDDQGLAVPWLMSLAISLAWCLHNCPIQSEVIITEPEVRIRQAYMAVDGSEPPRLSTLKASIPIKPVDGLRSRLSTTATEIVTSFLAFTACLPRAEMEQEAQVVFALTDFLNAREDKLKSCVLWRGLWRECLKRIYGPEIARATAKEQKFDVGIADPADVVW